MKKQKSENLKTRKGITLIALVITIIVILILVSVTISMAVNGGLFNYAGKATGDTNNAIKAEQELADGGIKVGDTYYDSIEDYLNGIESVKSLQEKYEFKYYSSLGKAVTDVNNGTIGASADVNEEDKETAVAGVYTENEKNVVVLLKDTTENTRIEPSVDMTINLGGNTLTIENDYAGFRGAANKSNTIKIDGRIVGSAIVMNGIDGAGYIINTKANTFIIDGGSYTINETKEYDGYSASFLVVEDGGTAIVENATIKVSGIDGPVDAINTFGTLTLTDSSITATSDQSYVRGIAAQKNTTVTNCKIMVASNAWNAHGISNYGTATISSSNIRAYSNYLFGDDTDYESASKGIDNYGVLTLDDCYVMGTHSGLQNVGTLYVDGGTYEGYGHGGFYLAADNTTSYIRNVTIRDCAMPEGYTATSNRNGAGFYMNPNGYSGSTTGTQIVYMDNCDIYGISKNQTIAMADNDKNILYISNSTINNSNGDIGHIRIDKTTHQLYIGAGNNFTAENTSLPEAVVVTDDVYRMN